MIKKIEWPPNYTKIYMERERRLIELKKDRSLLRGAKEFYKNHPKDFIEDWCITYDPRNASKKLPAILPFILFPKQREFIDFLQSCLEDQANGLVEKSRDIGATWLSCAYSVWLWLFKTGASIGWGSRKEQLVDKIGDPDSIFEKIRMLVTYLPKELWPQGFDLQKHASYMRLINKESGTTITGEAGDNIGRGGRKLIYFKDEAQPLHAKILTPYGWRTMADMQAGLEVIGFNGKPCKVARVRDCGVHTIYKVGFGDGTHTECSPNHRWTVDDVLEAKGRRTLRTRDIADDLVYTVPGRRTLYRFKLPVCEPVHFHNPSKNFPVDPYLFGTLIGIGNVRFVPEKSPRISCSDSAIVGEIRRLLPEGCILTQMKNRQTYSLVDVLGRRGKKHKSRAKQAVLASGIAGCRADTKFIPDMYKFASPADRLKLLHGLMDTGGSILGFTASYQTRSKQLAEDVAFVVRSLGGTSVHSIKPDYSGARDIHVLRIVLPDTFDMFRMKPELNAVNISRTVTKTVTSVSVQGKEPVRCISIDNKDGLYLTDNFIVTHNSAHYDRPERIEAALADNTNVQIDISSVYGTGNIFSRRRQAGDVWKPGEKIEKGVVRVFIFDWRDHPLKTETWYQRRRETAEKEGLLHIFAQEVDRDYTAAVEGIVIKKEWIMAAVDAHKKLKFNNSGKKIAALDVANEGGDKNAYCMRSGIVLEFAVAWGEGDTSETTQKAVHYMKSQKVEELQYDAVGVGAGVKGEVNRLVRGGMVIDKKFIAWNGALKPLFQRQRIIKGDRNSPLVKDFFANLKAQAWWQVRNSFERTYRFAVKGIKSPRSELISISSKIPDLRQLTQELSQATYSFNAQGKILIDKKPDGTKSPNLADAFVMCFWPIKKKKILI